MTEEDYYASRPIEPYSDDDSPSDWANIAHYAEENLAKAYEKIVKLEQENAALRMKVAALENANRAMVKELDTATSGGLSVLKNVVRSKEQLAYAKAVMRELLDNSNEYARERAEDFIKEEQYGIQ